MARNTHPLRDGHPDDAALDVHVCERCFGTGVIRIEPDGSDRGGAVPCNCRNTPLVSLGQGDYRRDIMPGDVSKGHTRREESKAIDALTRDAMRSGTVPLADSTPPAGQDATVGTDAPKRSVLPTLTPITTQVRKLELPESMQNGSATHKSRERLSAEAAADQAFARLRDNELDHLFSIVEAAAQAEERGHVFAINGESLSVMRRALACLLAQLQGSSDDIAEGGAS